MKNFAMTAMLALAGTASAQCILTDDLRDAAGIFTCGSTVSYQGYDYQTVQIGEDCWFAENLQCANYTNGDAIQSNVSDATWSNPNGVGMVAVYGEDAGCDSWSPLFNACDPEQSLAAHGRLYNGWAVSDARGLCPSGWHVSSDEEWTTMTDGLGGLVDAADALKSTAGWNGAENGSNSSGFNAPPSGNRNNPGQFKNAGRVGFWWTASNSAGDHLWARRIEYNQDEVIRYHVTSRSGFAVRCVAD